MQLARTLLFFLLLFGFGAVAGSSISRASTERKAAASYRSVEEIVDRFLFRKQSELVEALGLTDDQLAASAPALDATRSKLMTHQRKARSRVFQIMEEYRSELSTVLTPEQRERLDQAMEPYRSKTNSAPSAQ